MDQTSPPEPDGDGSRIVQQALRVAKKRRAWILLTGLATLSAAVAALSFVPSTYTSAATILIVEQQIPQSLVAPLSTANVFQKLDAMKHEVLSRARLLQIIDETGIFAKQKNLSPDAAVELMRKSIEIDPIDVEQGNTFSAFSISFTARTPEAAQEVTRRLSSLFIERSSEAQTHKATATTNFLNEQLEEKRKKVAALEESIRAFKIQYSGELPDDHQSNETRLDETRTQLQTTLANLDRARGQRAVWESMLSGNLNGALTRLKSERKALLTRFTPQHPDVVKKDEEISQLEALVGHVAAGASVPEKQLSHLTAGDPVVAQMEGQLESNRLEIEGLAKDEKRLRSEISQVQGHLSLAPAREQQLAAMTRELEALNQEIIGVAKVQQPSEWAADMDRRQEGQQFRQLDPASFPLRPTSPDRWKLSLGALIGGLALGFGLAFLMDFRNATFHSEKELRQHFSPPLIITVPLVPTPREKRRHNLKERLEWLASAVLAAAMLAVAFYVRRHP
jgi:polysaccharide chain length determinant protein (PEP-CTERM system associated)